MTLAFHQFADIFPLLDVDGGFEQFVDDVREHGVRDRIVILNGQILDGRNRYRALQRLTETGEVLGEGWGHRRGECLTVEALEPPHLWFAAFNPDLDGDPLAWVISKNLRRRHLTASQRGAAAAEVETIRHGGARTGQDAKLHLENETTRGDLAQEFGVSPRTIADAAKVRDHGIPELRSAIKEGRVAANVAAEMADLSSERQADIVAQLPRDATGRLTAEVKKALAPIVREIRQERQADKEQRRDEREQKLAERIALQFPGTFGGIIEDFEWDHEPYSRSNGMDRHASNHYPTAADAHTPEEIVARTTERFKCAAPDSVLYMWTTIPHCAIALQVMALRGYAYKTQRCWMKVRVSDRARGTGYWVTGEHEIQLIGVRGKFNASPVKAHFKSTIVADVGAHSVKPDEQYEHAEFHFPNLPKIELNARRRRRGWAAVIDGVFFPAPTEEELAVQVDIESQSNPTDVAHGCTASNTSVDGGAAELPAASPKDLRVDPRDDETLDIPAFLQRRPDSSLPDNIVLLDREAS